MAALVVYTLATTVLGSSDGHDGGRRGYRLTHMEIDSKAVSGRELGVNVIVPPLAGPAASGGC